jgi:hypothetical protein
MDHLCNVLRTRGKHQCHLGQGRQRGGLRIQQDVSDFFARRSAAGLARNSDGNALAFSARASFSICVLFPLPSSPSNVMNFPRLDATAS